MAGLSINTGMAISVESTGKTQAVGTGSTYVRSPMISSYMRPRFVEIDTRTNHTAINTRPTGYKQLPRRSASLMEWGGSCNLHDKLFGVLLKGCGFRVNTSGSSPDYSHAFTMFNKETANGHYLSILHQATGDDAVSSKISRGGRLSTLGLELSQEGAVVSFDGLAITEQDAFLNSKTITGITQADPAVVSSTAHGYSDGDSVYIRGVAGMTEVNDNWYIVKNPNANDFELYDTASVSTDSTGFTLYSSGGTANSNNALITEDGSTFLIAGTQSTFSISSADVDDTLIEGNVRSATINIEVALDEESKSLSSFNHSDFFINSVNVGGVLRGVPFSKALYEDLHWWDGGSSGSNSTAPTMFLPSATTMVLTIANDVQISGGSNYPLVTFSFNKVLLRAEPFDVTGDGQILFDIAFQAVDDVDNATEPVTITIQNNNDGTIYTGS